MSWLQQVWKMPPATNSRDNQVMSCSDFPGVYWLVKHICLSITSWLAQHIQGPGHQKEVRYWIWCPHAAFKAEYTPAFKHWALLNRKPLPKATEWGIPRYLPSRLGVLKDWIPEPMQLGHRTGATLAAKTTGLQSTDVGDATPAGLLHLLATPVRFECSPLAGVGCEPGSHLSFGILKR